MAPGSPASRLRQKPFVTIATPPWRPWSSSFVKKRPIAGATPSIGRKSADTLMPVSLSAGCPGSPRFGVSDEKAASDSKTVLRWRRSWKLPGVLGHDCACGLE